MGIKVGLDLIRTSGEKLISAANTTGFRRLTKPIDPKGLRLAPQAAEDCIHFSEISRSIKTKSFSAEEILDMKPSVFSRILNERKDIPDELKRFILSPEKLNLYDELSGIDVIRNMPKAKREEAFRRLFGEYNFKTSEADAQLEVIPDLVKKGIDLEILAGLPITNANKNQIEYILNRKDLLLKSWNKRAQEIITRGKSQNLKEESIKWELDYEKKNFYNKQLCELLKYTNDNNVKYLDECIELTNSPNILPYWTDDTADIIKNFGLDEINPEIFDRLYRRHHNFDSVKNIIGSEKLTKLSARLLEFKNFDKLKNIGTNDLQKLSIEEKKELLNGFISAISPKEAAWRNQNGLADISLLQSRMKIFKEIDSSSDKTFNDTYKDIISKILNSLPDSERQIIKTPIDTKSYRRDYRLKNPIPTLVDDIDTVLHSEIKEIKGRKIKIAKMNKEANFGISTHRIPNAESITTIEALEITDPNMLICVGTKGGKRGLNFENDGYALAVKPRYGTDWHVQAYSDIDSGNNALKNIYNFENIILNALGNHCGCIDLIPNQIKKVLDLSQRQYTQRMSKLKDCKTLQDIEKIDAEMAKAIRLVIKKQNLYEGLIRPETMGILTDGNKALEQVDDLILNYCERRNIPLIQVYSP